mgnify:CR=1 FL=1
MIKTIFKVNKMDCPSEEQIIRMKLAGLDSIKELHFDIPNRTLSVIHSDNYDEILAQLSSLDLDTKLISSQVIDDFIISKNHSEERKALVLVLSINIAFFIIEILAGLLANSMGLVADSLDMLADGIVYGLALIAVGRTLSLKKNIAKAAGFFQLILAVLGFIEVIRRFIGTEKFPDFLTMIVVSFFALIANTICLYILQKSKSKEAHIQASMIFTSNDIIINAGVIFAGIMVNLLNSSYPDLIIGLIVFVIVARGSFKIFQLAK